MNNYIKKYWRLIKRTLLLSICLFVGWEFLSININKPFWGDEAYSVLVSIKPFAEIIKSLYNDSGTPLYYFLAHIWIGLFGVSETAVRSFGYSCYFVSIVLTYFLTLKVNRDENFAFLIALLFAVSQVNVVQASTARMYPLLSLLCLWSSIMFIDIFINKKDNVVNVLLYLFTAFLAFMTHYWYIFFFGSQAFYLLIFSGKKVVKNLLLLSIPAVIFAAVWGNIFVKQSGNASMVWLKFSKDLIWHTFGYYFYDRTFQLLSLVLIPCTLGVFIVLRKLKFQDVAAGMPKFLSDTINNRSLIYMFINLTSVILITYCISIVKPIYCYDRQPIILLPAFLICVFYFVYKLSYKPVLFIVIGYFILRFSFLNLNNNLDSYNPEETKVRVISQHLNNGDLLVFSGGMSVFKYYMLKNRIDTRVDMPDFFATVSVKST
jgi:uncharacterized membrane protein